MPKAPHLEPGVRDPKAALHDMQAMPQRAGK